MKRHRFDPLSFTAGAFYIVVSILLSTRHVDLAASVWRWFGAAFLLFLGALLLLTSRRRSQDDS